MTDELAESDLAPESEGLDSLRALDGHLAIRSGQLRDRLLAADVQLSLAPLHGVSTALTDVQTMRFEIRDFIVHERLRRLEQLENGLARLRAVHDADLLLGTVCQAVVECCGFDRVMLSRVKGSMWRPWKSYAAQRQDAELQFRDWMAAVPEIPLDHLLLESEMVRRREVAIVEDAATDPRVSPVLREASGHRSYVAAPLMPEGRVVGFLHADYRDLAVTPLDRDVLAAFARAFDGIFERAVLLRRLREQRDQVRVTLQTVSTMLDELASAEIELAMHDHSSALSTGPARRSTQDSARGRLESLLTKRELEVLALVATGATNDRIAERLVISSDTVKTHMKHILRKLRAENRAEAIAHYLRLTLEAGEA
ncbi:MAG TPA: LuxR C-terminal-related transcriptional regulator [Intrasporangium sp.]|uniref:LuxR C-terminal-related transcriptional regulator n=1 Tax=Intrasporangium sp. TaxID=1925024 RepID=UPI002D79C5D5|nr:LuxR C-terminal-related transcriptional regulator [Intrasporangium sp.]HET7399110.1 LuxR C-terminal-related transcriptional regulator [Intrasporangium sp.]